MGEFYLLTVALVLYYFFDMRDRKNTRKKVVRRRATRPIIGPFIAASVRYVVVFMRRRHKFSYFTNNYTLIRRRFSIVQTSDFDIPRFGLSR